MKTINIFAFFIIIILFISVVPATHFVLAASAPIINDGVLEVKSVGGLFGIISGIFNSHTTMNSANSENPTNHVTSSNSIMNSQGGILGSSNTQNSAKLILDNGNLNCNAIASSLSGIPIPNGKVCDVVIVRQSPHNSLNNFIEFQELSSNSTNEINHKVFVMGDFALLETEVKAVQSIAKNNGWVVTGVHNPLASNNPTSTLMHWEIQNDINKIINQINQALADTSIMS